LVNDKIIQTLPEGAYYSFLLVTERSPNSQIMTEFIEKNQNVFDSSLPVYILCFTAQQTKHQWLKPKLNLGAKKYHCLELNVTDGILTTPEINKQRIEKFKAKLKSN
jgi:hypothetical protein